MAHSRPGRFKRSGISERRRDKKTMAMDQSNVGTEEVDWDAVFEQDEEGSSEDSSQTDESQSDEENEDSSGAPITQKEELSLPEFRQKYDDLVREMQEQRIIKLLRRRLSAVLQYNYYDGTELPEVDGDDQECILEQAGIIKDNITSGTKLMTHVGTDTAKLQCTLRHVKVCLDLSDRKFRRMGTAAMFNLNHYLENLMADCLDSREEYNENNLLRLITAEVHKCSTDVSSFISLLGVVDLTVHSFSAPASKARIINRNKYALNESQINATQHQIVNLNDRNGQHQGDDDDSISASQKLAEKLKRKIAEKHTTALGFYEFGLQDGTDTTHKFVTNVFSAASLARDGFARLIHNPEEKVTDKRLPYSNWKIQDAIPPPKTKKKNTNAVQRFQQIISFNSTTFKTLMETTMASPNNNIRNGDSRKGTTKSNGIPSKTKR